jgi:hypothetical protein
MVTTAQGMFTLRSHDRYRRGEPSFETATQIDIGKFFSGSNPGSSIFFQTPEGKTLLRMTNWWMSVPNHKDGNAALFE